MKQLIPINTERPHLFSPDIHVGMSVTLDKSIDSGTINNALRALEQRHPLLLSTICFDENNKAYYNLNTANTLIPHIEENDSVPWQDWIVLSNRTPFNFTENNMMRIHISRSNNATCITILAHHLLGDGLSFVYFMRDLLLAFDGKLDNSVIHPAIIQDETSLPKSGRLRLLTRIAAQKLNKDFNKSSRIFTFNDYKAIFSKHNSQNIPKLLTASLTIDETNRFIQNCKKYNVTINEALTAAFLSARHSNGITSKRLGISFNIRKELRNDPAQSMGNYVSGFIIDAPYDNSISLWDNAKEIGKIIKSKLMNSKTRYITMTFISALDDSLIDSINFIGYDNFSNCSSVKLLNILTSNTLGEGLAMSNLGKINIDTERFNIKEMYFVPPLFAPHDMVIGVLTTNNVLCISIRYPETKYSKKLIEKILNDAIKLIK